MTVRLQWGTTLKKIVNIVIVFRSIFSRLLGLWVYVYMRYKLAKEMLIIKHWGVSVVDHTTCVVHSLIAVCSL